MCKNKLFLTIVLIVFAAKIDQGITLLSEYFDGPSNCM